MKTAVPREEMKTAAVIKKVLLELSCSVFLARFSSSLALKALILRRESSRRNREKKTKRRTLSSKPSKIDMKARLLFFRHLYRRLNERGENQLGAARSARCDT